MLGLHTERLHLRLFLISFITLFVELMLIRWVPSQVRLIAYYANLMLISSFLGVGLGALLKDRGWRLFRFFPAILLFDVACLIFFRDTSLFSSSDEMRYFQGDSPLRGYLTLLAIFASNVALFVPLGEGAGHLFDQLPRLKAYSWDILGSLLGTLGFGAFSFLFFSPIVGVVMVSVAFLLLVERPALLPSAAALCASCALVAGFTTGDVLWSPYYHITIVDTDTDQQVAFQDAPEDVRPLEDPPTYNVRVNHFFYQKHGSIDPKRFAPGSRKHAKAAQETYYQFTMPYLVVKDPRRVLVVGAGSGKDVEGALIHGAQSIDAVEIDPMLIRIAKRFSANGVYFDSRVRLFIDDARSFFNHAEPVYDVVAFSYLDSQALFSARSSVRLDGYVYTVESIQRAYSLLNEGGVLSITFATSQIWMTKKLIQMVKEATGATPIVYTGPGIAILAPKGGAAPQLPERYGPFERFEGLGEVEMDLARDDWPFLYLRERTIPTDYLIVVAILVAFTIAVVRTATGMQWRTEESHFFALGFSFLLLQTANIARVSLYFGTTWLVTTLVIAGILLMVLLANLLAMRLDRLHPGIYVPLIVSVIVLIAIPTDWILDLSLTGRLAWTLLMVPLPVFFAGLVFSTSFRNQEKAASCWGANLLGATIGGFSEYLAMATGYSVVFILIIVGYAASFFLARRCGLLSRT